MLSPNIAKEVLRLLEKSVVPLLENSVVPLLLLENSVVPLLEDLDERMVGIESALHGASPAQARGNLMPRETTTEARERYEREKETLDDLDQKLSDCPFCTNGAPRVSEGDLSTPENRNYFVSCWSSSSPAGCGSRGPFSDTPQKAADLWNAWNNWNPDLRTD